ncbi:component of the polarisome [Ceratobasidium sp. 394]|nr:component of the polarisome [Ceratobasidium sp. 394]
MAAPAARRAPSPSASTAYSGISNYRSDSYRTGTSNSPRPGGPALPATDPRAIARTHYEELKRSLQDHMLREPQNSRANAREKLTRLTRQQFQELSTDVYDELMRRNNNEKGGAETPFLPVRDDFHPKRNQARQKLATLPPIRFKDLSSDVFYELGRRYPEFKEPETLPETPDTPQSDYDPPTPELVGGRAPMRQASRDQNFSAGGAGSGSDRRRPSQDDYGSLLEDLREMAASRDDMVAERDADTQTIRELSSQMQEYKRKYEAAKTELRGLKATSQLYVQQPANIAKQDQLPISERGGIVDIHITAFQSAMDTMLMAARQFERPVDSIDSDEIRRDVCEHEVATQLVERLRATLSNLVAAARTHAMSYGTSPVSLLDAAASHVSTTVTSLVREVLVRRDDGRRSSASGGVGGSWVQLEDELNGRSGGASGRRPMSDRSSSVGSPQNPAIFDTPLQTASTNGNGVGSDDSTMVEGSDEGWEELKPYLEAQSESIAFSIQALLSAIRTGAQGPEINENLTQIITIVSSIVAVSKDSLPRGGVKQGLEIIGQLSEQCDRLSELQGRAELSKQERQTMASNSFGVAKAMKELMKLG